MHSLTHSLSITLALHTHTLEQLSILQIAHELARLADLARANKLAQQDLAGVDGERCQYMEMHRWTDGRRDQQIDG